VEQDRTLAPGTPERLGAGTDSTSLDSTATTSGEAAPEDLRGEDSGGFPLVFIGGIVWRGMLVGAGEGGEVYRGPV